MKILFTGSILGHKPAEGQEPAEKDRPLLKAAEDIGYETVQAGHEVLIRNINSANVIDRYILEGIKRYCIENPTKTVSVEMHLPEIIKLEISNDYHGITIKQFYYGGHGGSYNKEELIYVDYLTATIRAVDRCDIAITMGDGETVRMLGSLSSSGKIPVVAIASFGGSSRDVFEQNRNYYSSRFPDSRDYSVLVEQWKADSTKRIIKLAEQLVRKNKAGKKKHKYFISYCLHDINIADNVELFLLRKNRQVIRDETFIRVGGDFPDRINALIAECDTFLIIGTKNYNESEWCRRELSIAVEKIKPKRIVYLDIDGTQYPIQVPNGLGIKASAREQTKNAIERLTFEEL